MSLEIGIVPNPEQHRDWQKIEAFLRPAADLAGAPVLEPWELVWAVYDGELLAAATARLTEIGYGEIILCGGRDAHLWAEPLAARMCEWFRAEGMVAGRIYGRKGWRRLLKDWSVIGEQNGVTGFERVLV